MSWPTDGKPRYIVREVEGQMKASISGQAKAGLSCAVLDRANCHRIVGQWRTEDACRGITRARSRFLVREAALSLALQLNAGEHASQTEEARRARPLPPPLPHWVIRD